MEHPPDLPPNDLLAQFRIYYHEFRAAVTKATSSTDPGILERLGDELDEFLHMVLQVRISIY
jgi:hypothetical protein